MNISDHFTRAKHRQKNKNARVIGVILGRQEGRLLELVNTIEIRFIQNGLQGEIAIGEDFARERIEAYKTMFTDLDVVGWYSVTGDGSESEK